MSRLLPLFGLLAVVLLATTGCEKTDSSLPAGMTEQQVADYRETLLTTEEPADAQAVIEVRDTLRGSGEEGAEPSKGQVTVIGVIGSMPNPYTAEAAPAFPWVDGFAAFSLVDPSTVAQFEGHQHAEGEECMFCAGNARKLVDTVAQVRFRDPKGEPIAARADKLLGLREGDTVVVVGTGSIELGSLVVDAQKVYVKPKVAEAHMASIVP